MRVERWPERVGAVMLISLLLIAVACEEEEQMRKERPQTKAEVSEEASSPPPVQVEPPSAADTTAMGRLKLHLPKPGHKGIPTSFTWNLFPCAESYQLLVLNMEEMVVYEGPRFVENLTSLPDGWDDELTEGVYYWQVLAFDAEGNPIGNSPYRDFLLIRE